MSKGTIKSELHTSNVLSSDFIVKNSFDYEVVNNTISNLFDMDTIDTINTTFLPKDFTIKEIIYAENIENYYDEWARNVDFLINDDDFITCEKTKVEDYIKNTLINVPFYGTNWLLQYYYNNIKSNHYNIIGLLHGISHIDYNLITPTGPIIAGDCLGNKDIEVVEFALKAFENWCNKDTVEYLNGKELSKPWLKKYLNNIIEYIKGI